MDKERKKATKLVRSKRKAIDVALEILIKRNLDGETITPDEKRGYEKAIHVLKAHRKELERDFVDPILYQRRAGS